MNKDGLKKVYLIKSAGYQYNEIDLHDNTLLLGDSGVGKTTLMRAVLFFYTMDYSDTILHINPATKKPFHDWYFKEHNSHIVYEYTRDANTFLLILSKSGKVHYTFVDISSNIITAKELLIEKDMPLSLEKLQENIQKHNLPNFTTTIKEKYINTLHKRDIDNKIIKQEAPVDFTLFESIASRKEFAKTLSNIFANSKVNSQSIKKSIVSLIEDTDAKINLTKIKHNLSEFISDKKEIEKFEKIIPNIEELAQTYKDYNAKKQAFKALVAHLEALRDNASYEIEKNKIQLTTLTNELSKEKTNFQLQKEQDEEKIEGYTKEIVRQNDMIVKLTEKKEYYEKIDITTLLCEYEKEQEYKNQYLHTQQRYDALTSDINEITMKYKVLLEDLEQKSKEQIFHTRQELQNHSEKLYTQKNDALLQKDTKIQEASKEYLRDKEELQKELQTITEAIKTTQLSLAEVKYFPFEQDKIIQYEQDIQRYNEEIIKVQHLLNNNSIEIKKVDMELSNIQTQLKENSAKIDQKTNAQKEELLKQKAELEQRLDTNSNNLYGFLHKNHIKEKDKIIQYVKNDILFSERKFHIKQHQNTDAIFGLEIIYEEELPPQEGEFHLQNKLTLVKEKIKNLNKQANTQKRKLEESATKEAKEKNRQRSALYAQKQELQEKERSYANQRDKLKNDLEFTKKKAKEQKNTKIQQLQEQLSNQEIEKEKITNQINLLEKKIVQITQKINQETQQLLKQNDEKIEKLKQEYEEKIKQIQQDTAQNKKLFEDELQQAIKEHSIDALQIDALQKELKTLKKKLDFIEKNRQTILVYLSEYKEEIESLPQKQINMQENIEAKDEVTKHLQWLKEKFDTINKTLNDQIQTLQTKQQQITQFLKEYELLMEKEDIAKAIQQNISLTQQENTPKMEDITTIIKDIETLYAKIQQNEQTIRASVLESLKMLQNPNIFKIEIEDNYINASSYLKTAKDLIEYVEQNKIETLKETLLDMFKSSINSIKKELDIFENALFDVEGKVVHLKNTINKAVEHFEVIDAIKIRFENSNSEILNAIKSLVEFYITHNDQFLTGLFSSGEENEKRQQLEEQLYDKITLLVDLLKVSKEFIELEDGFVLSFKVIEKGNDLAWKQTLNDIGSNGTSTLIKSIINISILQMVHKNIIKNNNLLTHCILDEIGIISTDYFKELKDFVNRSGFVFLNGMPTEDDMIISMYPTIYIGQNYGKYSKMILASKVEL